MKRACGKGSDMRGRCFGRRKILAVVLLAGASGGPLFAQSAGEQLVRREVQDRLFEAREELVLHEEPESLPVLTFLWRDGEPTGERILAGVQVRVSEVKESALGWRRFVWVKVESAEEVDQTPGNAVHNLPAAPNDPAEQSASGEQIAEDRDPATVTGWLKLGGQHMAIAALKEHLQRVDENPKQ